MAAPDGTDWWDSRLSGHEAPTPKADAADRANDDACHHYGFGDLDLLWLFGLVALLAGLIRKTSRLTGFRTPVSPGAFCMSDRLRPRKRSPVLKCGNQ